MTSRSERVVDDRLLDIHGIAAFLGKSSNTAAKWCSAGKLPAKKLGGRFHARLSDLQAWWDHYSEESNHSELGDHDEITEDNAHSIAQLLSNNDTSFLESSQVDVIGLAHWAGSKACDDWRRNRSCNHAGCRRAEQAGRLLKRMEKFQGVDKAGRIRQGWLIPVPAEWHW